jgi:(p)ppGpp synthase/HD superfamily hydrolase
MVQGRARSQLDDKEAVALEPFERGLEFAAKRHKGHLRKGTGTPYIAHLLQVSGIVLEYGGNEVQAVAALLHDVVEDQKATVGEVREEFGSEVAAIVEGCSDTDQAEKEEWWQRKRTYVEDIARKGPEVRLVSAADKLHNARAILKDYRTDGDAVFERFKGKKAGTIWYYRALIDAFRATNTDEALIDELNRTVAEIERLAFPDHMSAPPR